MRFVFDELKAAQAAAYLLKLHGGTMNYMVLIKLLYLADRQALIETGSPVTRDRMVSMPHGPVLSNILDLINMGRPQPAGPWFDYITEPSNYDVSLEIDIPASDELSRYELDLLKQVHDRFGSMDKWALRDLTHTLPEWVDPRGSSVPIDPESILRAAGKSPEQIEKMSADAEELWFLDTVEGSARGSRGVVRQP
jgi:uncharacterized phage-associated protein